MKKRFTDKDDWLSEFKKGNASAFQHVFDTYNKRLHYYADQMLDDKEEAADVVSDSFKKLWERYADFNSEQHVSGFLYTATRNACINRTKHNQRKEDAHEQLSLLTTEKLDTDFLNDMIEGELLQVIYAAIETLPKKCKLIFQLALLEELSTKEIAERLKISERNVLNQKNRAIRLLKSKLLISAITWSYISYLLFK